MKTEKERAVFSSRRNFIKQGGLAMTALALPFPITIVSKQDDMKNAEQFDVIIIGGSYSGLAAAMALGRALKKVLIIDSGKPCNAQTPYSHNFLTQDGNTPAAIASLGKLQVQHYNTVAFLNSLSTSGRKTENGFEIQTASGGTFHAGQLIFATGIRDLMPEIRGFSDCWGISAIHCPYCHGYEVRNEKTGILLNGEHAYEMSRLISNWTKDLTLFTNGVSTFTFEQRNEIEKRHIKIVEKKIESLEHTKGYLENIVFTDGTKSPLKALYAPRPFEQHCTIPETLGCELTEEGYIKVDALQATSVEGVFACGDTTTRMRAVAMAVSAGTMAGIAASKKIIFDAF